MQATEAADEPEHDENGHYEAAHATEPRSAYRL
jgi:hypothetical protein